ncbi:periostin isoform X2 [Gadus morhua]|uniref:periostin isoform X2 n=1 Tax=Gadus morhua TaxID=8049 RepID=UPI0011B55902|nr:periostin isoform X2 [Gadus morhua]
MKLVSVVTLVVLTAWSLDRADGSAYDTIVSHSRIRARKEGPNVCALQQVMGTKKKYFSTCRNWYKGSICGKKAIVLYECCPGYMKLEGMRGCPAVAPIDNVHGTLGLLKATKTQEYAEASSIAEELSGKGSFTMFAPSNDAWEELDPLVKAALVSNVNVELFNALHYHMVNSRLLTKDLKNSMTLTSMYNELGLYINHYSNGIVTVNCARIIHGNQVATNGVVHVVDRVVSTVSSTIKDTLEVDDDLTSFSTLALASGMMEKLGEPGQYTLFAPTNRAFEKLGSGYLERIMGDQKIMSALVNYHLLNSVQCGEAIMMGTVYETAEGSSLQIGCDGDRLTVNGITMVLKKDIVTTNGVIHLIDQVLVPDSAKEVMELVGENQSTFSDMVAELGLSAALGPGTEYTLLAPVNTVFTDEVMRTDQTLLKETLENHILKLKVTLSELYNGQQLETLFGNLLRVFIYRTAVCIENACMLRGGKEGSNGALHLMRSLIKPARRSMYEILVADGRFRVFLSLMESAGLTQMLEQEGSYTVFAPTDDAFNGLSEEDLTLLTGDVNALRTILLYHFSNGVFINGGLEGGVTNLLKTLQGQNLQVLSVNNSIHVNSVDVPDNDLMATNGVVHVVKNILYPANIPVGREDLLLLLRKIIKYIQIKFVSGYSYSEIPLTFIMPGVTKVTRVISGGEPTITKVTRVINAEPITTTVVRVVEEEPTLTSVTRVIGGDASLNTLTVHGETAPTVTKVTRVVHTEPSSTKVMRVVEGEGPTLTTVTRVIGGESSVNTLTGVFEVEPTVTKVTRVVSGGGGGKGSITRVVSSGGEGSITRVVGGGGEGSVTRVVSSGGGGSEGSVTRVVSGGGGEGSVTRVVDGGEGSFKVTRVVPGGGSVKKVTRVVEGEPSYTTLTRVISGEPPITTRTIESEPTISRVVVGGEHSIHQVTRMIQGGEPSVTKVTVGGEPGLTKVTRIIETHSGDMGGEMKKVLEEEVAKIKKHQEEQLLKIVEGGEAGTLRILQPQIFKGSDFSKITTIHGDPNLIELESERISKLIRDGGPVASARRPPVGVRRRKMKARRHIRPRQ